MLICYVNQDFLLTKKWDISKKLHIWMNLMSLKSMIRYDIEIVKIVNTGWPCDSCLNEVLHVHIRMSAPLIEMLQRFETEII